MTGAVAGLATITPAAGYVTIQSAAIIGIIPGIGCYLAVKFKEKRDWDDALDVWGIHGIGGLIGTLMLGFFATKTINPNGADGLFYGEVLSSCSNRLRQFFWQWCMDSFLRCICSRE